MYTYEHTLTCTHIPNRKLIYIPIPIYWTYVYIRQDTLESIAKPKRGSLLNYKHNYQQCLSWSFENFNIHVPLHGTHARHTYPHTCETYVTHAT